MFKQDLALYCITYVSLSFCSLTKTIKSGYRNYIIMPHVVNSFKHQCQQLFQVTNARLYFASISCLRRRKAETCCLSLSFIFYQIWRKSCFIFIAASCIRQISRHHLSLFSQISLPPLLTPPSHLCPGSKNEDTSFDSI